MPKYSGDDPYINPASGVLKNRLGITDEALLEAAEADFAAERSRELSKTPLSHLAQANAYYIAWEDVKRADMLQASIDSFSGDTSKLAAIIRDNLYPLAPDPSAPIKPKKNSPEPGGPSQ